MIHTTRAAVAAGLISFAGIGALAHSGATGIVKERMEAMKAMGDAVKSVAPMFRGETAYDPAGVRDAAQTIRSHAGEELTRVFPKDTNDHPSEAKDEIWRDWETFAALARQLEVTADGLARAANNGLGGSSAMSDATGMMGGSGHMMGSSESMMGGSGHMMGNSGGMMGGSGPMGTDGAMMDADHLADMPADAVFSMMSRTCSTCHTRFRAEDD